jgi:hypothetical protein
VASEVQVPTRSLVKVKAWESPSGSVCFSMMMEAAPISCALLRGTVWFPAPGTD